MRSKGFLLPDPALIHVTWMLLPDGRADMQELVADCRFLSSLLIAHPWFVLAHTTAIFRRHRFGVDKLSPPESQSSWQLSISCPSKLVCFRFQPMTVNAAMLSPSGLDPINTNRTVVFAAVLTSPLRCLAAAVVFVSELAPLERKQHFGARTCSQ